MWLHLGLVSEIKRKALPAIAKAVGLNNEQLIIQPFIYNCLLKPWLKVFENWYLRVGFRWLIEIMNEYMGYVPIQVQQQDLYFSSA